MTGCIVISVINEHQSQRGLENLKGRGIWEDMCSTVFFIIFPKSAPGLGPLKRWDAGFKSRSRHRCLPNFPLIISVGF
jgi:hypothetical protein